MVPSALTKAIKSEQTSVYLSGRGLHGTETRTASIQRGIFVTLIRLVRLVCLAGPARTGGGSDAAVNTGSQESLLVGAAAVLLDAGRALELVQAAVL